MRCLTQLYHKVPYIHTLDLFLNIATCLWLDWRSVYVLMINADRSEMKCVETSEYIIYTSHAVDAKLRVRSSLTNNTN